LASTHFTFDHAFIDGDQSFRGRALQFHDAASDFRAGASHFRGAIHLSALPFTISASTFGISVNVFGISGSPFGISPQGVHASGPTFAIGPRIVIGAPAAPPSGYAMIESGVPVCALSTANTAYASFTIVRRAGKPVLPGRPVASERWSVPSVFAE
jgi:hypothetical protein